MTWSDIQIITKDLAALVAADGSPQVIVGITRGGLIPAVMIAHVLGVRDLRTLIITHTAAEALSAGTPVITYDLGYVPTLVGPAGRAVALEKGFAGLWDEVLALLADHDAYHAASVAAPSRIEPHTPVKAAHAFLAATA